MVSVRAEKDPARGIPQVPERSINSGYGCYPVAKAGKHNNRAFHPSGKIHSIVIAQVLLPPVVRGKRRVEHLRDPV